MMLVITINSNNNNIFDVRNVIDNYQIRGESRIKRKEEQKQRISLYHAIFYNIWQCILQYSTHSAAIYCNKLSL